MTTRQSLSRVLLDLMYTKLRPISRILAPPSFRLATQGLHWVQTRCAKSWHQGSDQHNTQQQRRGSHKGHQIDRADSDQEISQQLPGSDREEHAYQSPHASGSQSLACHQAQNLRRSGSQG